MTILRLAVGFAAPAAAERAPSLAFRGFAFILPVSLVAADEGVVLPPLPKKLRMEGCRVLGRDGKGMWGGSERVLFVRPLSYTST